MALSPLVHLRCGKHAQRSPRQDGRDAQCRRSAYQAGLTGAPSQEIGARRTLPGTVNAAVAAYYRSKSFTETLAPETQRMRRAILERFRAEHGDKRIALLQHHHIVRLLAAMKPYAQKNWLKTIRGLMVFAVADNIIASDPTDGVKPIT